MAQHPNPIDIHVGARLRQRRTLLGMSQDQLAQTLGVTFQQVQKYERGANRIGASRLFELACALSAPVGFFFEGLSEETAADSVGRAARQAAGADAPLRRETLELVRAYYRIPDARLRRKLFELAKAAGTGPPGGG